MKAIDKKGNIFGKLNIIDALVIFVIIMIVAAGAYKFLRVNPQVAAQEKMMEITIKVEGVRQPTVDIMHEGDQVQEYDSNLPYGEIIKKEVMPATDIIETADGRFVEAEIPNKYDMMLTFAVQGTVNNNSITVASKEMRIGGKLVIKTNIYAVNGKIFNIKIIE